MGNPHYVVFVTEFAENWQDEAATIQRSSQFKHGVNVELVAVDGRHDVRARFFERGVGETQSSGNGFLRIGGGGDDDGPSGIARSRACSGRNSDSSHGRESGISSGPGAVSVPRRVFREVARNLTSVLFFVTGF